MSCVGHYCDVRENDTSVYMAELLLNTSTAITISTNGIITRAWLTLF